MMVHDIFIIIYQRELHMQTIRDITIEFNGYLSPSINYSLKRYFRYLNLNIGRT